MTGLSISPGYRIGAVLAVEVFPKNYGSFPVPETPADKEDWTDPLGVVHIWDPKARRWTPKDSDGPHRWD